VKLAPTPTKRARTRQTSSVSISRACGEAHLVEHASDIAEEYYASFTSTRAKKYLGMLSAPGRR